MLRVPLLSKSPGPSRLKGPGKLAPLCPSLWSPVPGNQSQTSHNERVLRRRESSLCSATKSPGHPSPPREGAEKDAKGPLERVMSPWDILNPNQKGGTLFSLHLCTGAWQTAVPSWRPFMPPHQAVPGDMEAALMKPIKACLFLQLFPGRALEPRWSPTSA